MPVITQIDDFKPVAKRKIPRMFYDLVDAGSYTETTYRANEADLATIRLKPRVCVNVADRSLATTMAGQPVSLPVALAPVGSAGTIHADGEILAARAAEAAGVPFTLSTMSICSIEDVAAAVKKPFWFQLYMMKDRDFVEKLIARARAANCSALVMTVDLPTIGQRHKDYKNGMVGQVGPLKKIANLLNYASKPGWCLDMARTPRRHFGNVMGHVAGIDTLDDFKIWSAANFDPSITWKDVEWVRSLWDGPLILKGIMTGEDAEMAASCGTDAIVVSNHGGRQLDGAPSSISALPRIADAVGDRLELWMDGGVRRGQDILKARALGARGVFIGRAFLYGLAAAGQAGVARSLDILRGELDVSLALCGYTDINQVTTDCLADWREQHRPEYCTGQLLDR
jgi:L-lactate dehydrogenase (cytochrome)